MTNNKSSIGINIIKQKLNDFLEEIDSMISSDLNVSKDPFMFTFMLYDKNANNYKRVPGYKWIFPESTFRDAQKKVSSEELNILLNFVYIGDYEISHENCGGACWRIARKGKFHRMVYGLNEPFGDYVYSWNNEIVYDGIVIKKIKEIENILWSPLEKSNKVFLIIQQEISCVDKKEDKEKFSLQILGRLPILSFQENYNILINLFDEWKIKFAQNFDEVIFQRKIYTVQLKTAIISILIDSYAHNISAHSLAALKWWIELRHKMLDKRIKVESNEVKIKGLLPEINITERKPQKEESGNIKKDDKENILFEDQDPLYKTTQKYYEALGLTDSTYNASYYSLFDFLQFADQKTVKDLFKFTDEVDQKESNQKFHPRFPVPIDYALYPFFRFLRDKGAFWSGVTRDVSNGGETKTWYKILWEDFANNPLYLGTIAKSEGITKININLAVKNGEEFYHGRFVTIDLSVIEYEEKLANEPNLVLKEEDKHLLEINHKDEEHCSTNNCKCIDGHKLLEEEKNCFHNNDKRYVKTESYSKYAFVRLGKCFAHFREILDTEDFTAYLPGGIIGEHALFTIFENQIRNIKHYKNDLDKLKDNGIDFWISIEKDKLNINNKESAAEIEDTKTNTKESAAEIEDTKTNTKDDKDKTQLFKVGLWLAHATDLGNVRTVDDKPNYDNVLIKKVTDSTIQPILDDNGSPRMGGNSQDKACAAMLFNNEFKVVERKNNDKERKYFPWITFATAFEEKPFNDVWIDKGKSERYLDLSEDNKKDEYAAEYLKKIGINNKNDKKYGYLKKYFYLWQGADYIEVTDVKDLEGENVSRFKFAIVNVDDMGKKKEIILKLRRDGVIRILENIFIESIKNNIRLEINNLSQSKTKDEIEKEVKIKLLQQLYLNWFKIWIDLTNKLNICFTEPNGQSPKSHLDVSTDSIDYVDEIYLPQEQGENFILPLTHGGELELSSCNIRSHGSFWNKFFGFIKEKEVKNLKCKYEYSSVLLFEFAEVILSQIVIFDKRLFNRFNALGKEKQKIFEDNLKLHIYDEKLEIEKNGNTKKYEKVLPLIKEITHKKLPLILIMHLSFIESLGSSEENIYKFINEHISELFDSERFIFIVTTGRGRDSWRTHLEKDDKELEIIRKSFFKPVESLLNAVESGISYKDDFDVKYNLIKVIFGS